MASTTAAPIAAEAAARLRDSAGRLCGMLPSRSRRCEHVVGSGTTAPESAQKITNGRSRARDRGRIRELQPDSSPAKTQQVFFVIGSA